MISLCPQMAKLSSLAYLDGKEAKPKMKALGYTTHKFLDRDGAQCHILSNKNDIVIVFRGTEPTELSDVAADLNIWPDEAFNGVGLVHNGFQEELNKLWKGIESSLKIMKTDGKNLYIAGHSLGGAMATLCASRMLDNVTALYTYGSPRVGNLEFVNHLQRSKLNHYRHVNNNDIVTAVPFWLLGYRHYGPARYINHYGNIRKLTVWQKIKDKMRGRWASIKDGNPVDGIGDHDITKYYKHCERNNTELK